MCPIESSVCRPACPPCESRHPMLATKPASSRGGSEACSRSRRLDTAGASICAACPGNSVAHAGSGRQGCLHRQAATSFDRAGAPPSAKEWRGDQRLGGSGIATGAETRLRPWLTPRARRGSKCGCNPLEIVWRRKKWQLHTGCWSPRHQRWPMI